MICQSCKSDLGAGSGLEFCPRCLAAIGPAQAAAIEPPPAPEPLPSGAGSAARAGPAAAILDAWCPSHPGLPVAGSCSRCGGFVCVQCVPEVAAREKIQCSTCVDARRLADAAERGPKVERDLWASFLVLSAVVAGLFVAMPALLGARTIPGVVSMLVGTLVAAGLCAAGVGFRVWRHVAFLWLGLFAELGALVLMMGVAGLGPNLLSALFLVAPLATGWRLAELLALRRASSSGAAQGG